MLITNLIDILFHRLPAEVYEPIYVAGILGITTAFFSSKRKFIRESLVLLLVIFYMILWRALFYSGFVSRRYFEVTLIPFLLFSGHGCNSLSILSRWQKTKTIITPRVLNFSFVVLLIVVGIFEIAKLQRSDFYCYTKLQSCNRYINREDRANHTVLFVSDAHELNRLKYYSNIDANRIFEITDNDILNVYKIVPNVLFCKNVLFYFEYNKKSFPEEMTEPVRGLDNGKQICRVFTSKKKNRFVSCFLYSPNPTPALQPDPISVQGENEYIISPEDFTLKNSSVSFNGSNPVITGQRSTIFAKDFIPVPQNNRLDLTAEVKNVGNTTTHVYIGYAFYDKDKNLIGAQFYPERHVNIILRVLSARKGDSFMIVNKMPLWRKKCSIALDAKDDLSDVPNNNILDGLVSDVEQLPDGNAKIYLSKPLAGDISPNTPIRLQNVSGAYVYMFSDPMVPGEEVISSTSIAKYDSFPYYSTMAISRGVYFVKPLILSYSTEQVNNSIEISNWILRY